ncbi:unnamed protein product [Withania somnifera]
MEERTPSKGNGKNNIRKLSTATSLRLAPSLPPDRSDTYIIQIPRDQVYRVPPPEYAKIVENYRLPKDNSQRKRKCGCCCWILLGLLIFGIIIGVIIGVIHLMYIPRCPNFSVVGVHFKNVTDTNRGQGKKNQPKQWPKFEFDLKVNNVNERMDVSFGQGKTNFVFRKYKIGQGKYPSNNSLKAKHSNNNHLSVDVGSNGKLPDDLLKVLEDDKKLIPVTMMIHVPMEIKSWVRNMKKNNLEIACEFDVEQLTKKSKVMPNECITDF